MIYEVDLSKSIWRYLYHEIYDRIYRMGVENDGTEETIKNRILRLVAKDSNLYLLVGLKDSNIISHALINILGTVAFIEQVEAERRRENTFAQEVLTYIENVIKKEHPEITQMLLNTKRDEYRALERKYGFSVFNILMKKDIKENIQKEEEEK